MNKDIRLATSFKGHRKRKRLRRLIGDRSDSYLIDLWLTVAMDCPDGVLTGWDTDDIADACGWDGDPEDLVTALVQSKWLERNSEGILSVHDWCEHQGWACKAKERSETASKNILLRWTIKRIKKKDIDKFKAWFTSQYHYEAGHTTDDVLTYYHSYTSGIDPNNGSNTNANTPSPSPSPSPLPYPNNNTPKPSKREGTEHQSPAAAPSGDSFKKKSSPVLKKNNNQGHTHYFEAINKACDRILRLPAKAKKFNPYKWAQQNINEKKHPGAVMETLQGLELFWPSAEDPWGICNKIMRTKNGNWNEKEAIAIHNELKSMQPGQLEFHTNGLLKEMP